MLSVVESAVVRMGVLEIVGKGWRALDALNERTCRALDVQRRSFSPWWWTAADHPILQHSFERLSPDFNPIQVSWVVGGLFINTLALLTPGWSERDRESLRGAPWNCPEPRALMEGDIMDKLEDMASVYEFDPLTDNIPATKVEITVSCR